MQRLLIYPRKARRVAAGFGVKTPTARSAKSIALCAVVFLLPQAAAAEQIALFTGQKTATYYAFGKDMAQLLPDKNFSLDVRESDGSMDNIKRMSGADKVTLGIVQSDVLGFLRRSHNAASKEMVSRLRVVFPLYQEEIHVLAREEIHDFKELQGKKVAIGEEGSGHMLTAVNLFAIEQITPSEIKKITPEEGIVAVLKGDLDAVIFVGGKPVKIFKNMEDLTKKENQKYALLLQNVHFLPLNDTKLYAEYEPTEITPQDYNFVKSIVPTIAVQAALVSYASPASKPSKTRCASLKQFADALRTQLPALRASGHPKWQEVNLAGSTHGWQKDACVWGK